MKTNVVLTGATGMVGEGVLLECLENSAVEKILLINRRPSGFQHPKVREIVHENFFDLSAVENEFKGFDSCFFCLGVSSVGMSEADYKRMTYDLTMNFVHTLARHTKDITFCYVTGRGTDSTEKGRVAWARVKGKTENEILKIFPKSVMFRPAAMKPTEGQKRVNKFYKYVAWMYNPGRKYFPKSFCTIQEVGRAMINAATKGSAKRIVEVEDIVSLAKA